MERSSRNPNKLGRKEGCITSVLGIACECVLSLLHPVWKEARLPLTALLLIAKLLGEAPGFILSHILVSKLF